MYDVHYVCMLAQRFEPHGRRFRSFRYYYVNMHGAPFVVVAGSVFFFSRSPAPPPVILLVAVSYTHLTLPTKVNV